MRQSEIEILRRALFREKTARKQAEKILEVKLYPNPAQEIVYIRFNTVVSNLNNFQIFYQDMNGIVLKKSTASIAELLNGFQEDISFLKSGLYIVSLISEDFVYKLKLLKK